MVRILGQVFRMCRGGERTIVTQLGVVSQIGDYEENLD